MLSRSPLREGVRDLLQTLAFRGVPGYIFSDGLGDIAAQVNDDCHSPLNLHTLFHSMHGIL